MKWLHRIDAVPAPGRRIEFKRGDEPSRFGVIVLPPRIDTFRAGLGDDVRIKPDGGIVLLIPSLSYTHWRYADDGPENVFWDG